MKFEINLDDQKLGISEEVRKVIDEQKGGDKGLFETTLNNLIGRKYEKGLPNIKSRALNRFLNKLDLCDNGSLEIDKTELDLLQDVFLADDVIVLPGEVRIVGVYQDRIEALINDKQNI